MKKSFSLIAALILVNCISLSAQSVSLSPSRVYFKAAPGETKKQVVHVTNNSDKKQSFTITFGDFSATGTDGKTQMIKAGESEHTCSAYMNASPSFFELAPGASQDIEVIIDLPNLPEANKVKWGTMMLKLTKEKTEANNSAHDGVGMGILETFQFVVHIFQTPPSVTLKQAEIENFKELTTPGDSVRTLALITKNTGEAILDCATYLEFSNLKTGYEQRTKPAAFTMLPGGGRQMKFIIPKDLPKGSYTVTAVVDIGSKDAVQAAEMDVDIQ
jgi:P pilus assembly chaperone PapD